MKVYIVGIYTPGLYELGCKILMDWDTGKYEKSSKNCQKKPPKMLLFEISQFEQLL